MKKIVLMSVIAMGGNLQASRAGALLEKIKEIKNINLSVPTFAHMKEGTFACASWMKNKIGNNKKALFYVGLGYLAIKSIQRSLPKMGVDEHGDAVYNTKSMSRRIWDVLLQNPSDFLKEEALGALRAVNDLDPLLYVPNNIKETKLYLKALYQYGAAKATSSIEAFFNFTANPFVGTLNLLKGGVKLTYSLGKGTLNLAYQSLLEPFVDNVKNRQAIKAAIGNIIAAEQYALCDTLEKKIDYVILKDPNIVGANKTTEAQRLKTSADDGYKAAKEYLAEATVRLNLV